ncbi:patatin-like phospholipase family protein [Roseomonas marmotae]|uniref:Patatin-like phospholipase family protein n=1 Tax=Roseomonas marmotae TaxID=2768161 RepID=A0ABS3K6U2_9PROT|nr:patatin-like phospholipase family protein [Roseomonas marmotae]MBO1073163.1 patatin-like phospholipase family protein [Roseomonas marmotae]QTI79202.1 patatin-like phospholipase family protein [Roseomonas marmotae]
MDHPHPQDPHATGPAGKSWCPGGSRRVALVLQGGGALGAFQAGVYEALEEAGIGLDWLAGVSIGAVNGALIAGNPPERRLAALREFWDTVTTERLWPFGLDLPEVLDSGDWLRQWQHEASAALTMLQGQPGFFTPNVPSPWLSVSGMRTATAFYDSAPLRQTLRRLVDFGRLNDGGIRLSVGAVNVGSGNFAYFDNARMRLTEDHIMASGALPPALPMIRVDGESYWDGGLVSNTPLAHLLENLEDRNTLAFQVDLFSARGPVPRSMPAVLARQKDIQYSSRTRMVTNAYRRLRALELELRRALALVPEDRLDDGQRALKRRLERLPEVVILHLIYRQQAHEGQAKDYEFSSGAMREHWHAGLEDTRATLRRGHWLAMPPPGSGIQVYDIHRP